MRLPASWRSSLLAALAVFSLLPAARPESHPDPLAQANSDLQAGKADDARTALNAALAADPKNAEANNLLCRVEFTLQQMNEAADHCQKAVDIEPANSLYHLWLGRALGERASRASFLSAFSLAKKTAAEFETSVRLDPHNVAALMDLGQFDIEAPGAVGGGMDKAQAVAAKLDAADAAAGHDFHASIAEKEQDLASAEKEFKTALVAGGHTAHAWMRLASFYRRHERWPEMQSAVNSGTAAAARDRHSAVALSDGASILIRANQQPEQAAKLLESYIASPDKSEEAPAVDALVKLAKLRAQLGDRAAAEHDREAALALAHDYKPAEDLKF